MPDDEMTTSGKDEETILLQRVAERQQTYEAAVWDLVGYYSRTDRQPLAFAYVQRLMAATDDPGKRAFFALSLGQLLEQVRDYEAAITAYTDALALEPTDPEVWYFINNNLGYCLNRCGRHDEAEARCRAAIEADPGRHNAHKNLGIALECQGRFDDAAAAYRVAIQANPADPRALRHLECLLVQHPDISSEGQRG
jgi:Flp pilus assembly protein TadD